MAKKNSHDLEYAHVSLSRVDPVRISGNVMNDEVKIPLATYETPLWSSHGCGAKVSCVVEGGIAYILVGEKMTRLVIFILDSITNAVAACDNILSRFDELKKVAEPSSCFAKLVDTHFRITSRLLFVRSDFFSDDASGRNMATLALERLVPYLMEQMPELDYGSISGNYCTDKKASAVNGILGRDKYMIARVVIPEPVVRERLRTTIKRLAEPNERKNLIGSIMAGLLRSGNTHYTNMLLGFCLAIGQDVANIVEDLQGPTQVEAFNDGSVRFSYTLPHLAVGSVGSGKGLDFAEKNPTALGYREDCEPGENARRLIACCTAVAWCGELSLLAARTNPGELMEMYVSVERAK